MTESVFKSGFVTLVGRPNVGKSTLINQLSGQKIAAVSPRPQTTQRRQLAIITKDQYQIIFMDTPGIHKSTDRLDQFMNDSATETLLDADVIVWIVDVTSDPDEGDEICAAHIRDLKKQTPVILLLNKVDAISSDELKQRKTAYLALSPDAVVCEISALKGSGNDEFIQMILDRLPEGPCYYDPEQITDLYERDIASDLIRQTCLNLLRDEVPHGIGVRIDEYSDRDEDLSYVQATLFVERESHKGIVIGKKGSMLKKIGSTAREEIERMTERDIYLELKVKVNKNWRNKPEMLNLLGYSMSKR
ncbi:MAG: GTPase Era [Anaerolineaceae bacterium]|nr:GTPase Era [Anaerolineaceae bacterium]